MNADQLDRLQYGRSDDDKEPKGVVQDILLSPLLKRMLRDPLRRWFGRGITVNAVLNRKEIGDDDGKVIVNILILKAKTSGADHGRAESRDGPTSISNSRPPVGHLPRVRAFRSPADRAAPRPRNNRRDLR
jgi:hypothetical protein